MNNRVFKKKKTGVSTSSNNQNSSRFSISKKTHATNPNDFKTELEAINQQNIDVLGSLVQDQSGDFQTQVSTQLDKARRASVNMEKAISSKDGQDKNTNNESFKSDNIGFFNANIRENISVIKLEDNKNNNNDQNNSNTYNDDTTIKNAVITNVESFEIDPTYEKPFATHKANISKSQEVDPKNWKSLGGNIKYGQDIEEVIIEEDEGDLPTERKNNDGIDSETAIGKNIDEINEPVIVRDKSQKDLRLRDGSVMKHDIADAYLSHMKKYDIDYSSNKDNKDINELNNGVSGSIIKQSDGTFLRNDIADDYLDKMTKIGSNENLVNSDISERNKITVQNQYNNIVNKSESSFLRSEVANAYISDLGREDLANKLNQSDLYNAVLNKINDKQQNDTYQSNKEIQIKITEKQHQSEVIEPNIEIKNISKEDNLPNDNNNDSSLKSSNSKQPKKRESWLSKVMDENTNPAPIKKTSIAEISSVDNTRLEELKIQIAELKANREAVERHNKELESERDAFKKEVNTLKYKLEYSAINKSQLKAPDNDKPSDDIEKKIQSLQVLRYANSEALIRMKMKIESFKEMLSQVHV